MRYATTVVCGVLIAIGLSARRAVAETGALDVRAEPVASAPEDQAPQRIAVSPEGQHIAFVSTRGSRFVVVVDGKPSKKYDEIGHINWANNREVVFSNDGQHVMFWARKGQDQIVVVDGQELPGYQLIDQFAFSPDGKQNAFIAQRDLQNIHYVAVVNGKDSPVYRKIDGLQFSPNGAHLAYIVWSSDVKNRAPQSVVVDGKAEPEFVNVRNFCFSANGDHWAYIADDQGNVDPLTPGQKSHLMVDGKEVASYEKIYNCQLSADGHVMYMANKHTHKGPQQETVNDQCVGLDTQVWDLAAGYRFPWYESGQVRPAILSADGQHVAWVEQDVHNDQYVTLNGKRGLGYKQIQELVFGPDSQHIYYVAGQDANGMFVVRDEDEAGPYKHAPNGAGTPFKIYQSPDGKHYAYQAGDGQMTFVVEDGKQQSSYAAIRGPLAFSPEAGHLAYICARDTMSNLKPIDRQQAEHDPKFDHGRYLVVDGEQQILFPTVQFHDFGVHFSPDGKHLAYTDDGNQIVVDGRLVKKTPGVPQVMNGTDATLQFTPDSKHVLYKIGLHYLIDGDEAAGYAPINCVPNYKPVFLPDGSVFFFATKDGESGGVVSHSTQDIRTSAALYRVTVNPGAARDFGATASTADASDNNPSPPQANSQPGTPNQKKQPPPKDSQSAADKAREKARKAKEAADKLRGILGH